MRTLAVATVLAIGLTYAILGKPQYSLLLYWWITFFRPQDWAYHDLITPLRLSLVTCIIFILKALLNNKRLEITTPLSIGIILFVVGGVFSHFNSINSELSTEWLTQFGAMAMVLLLSLGTLQAINAITLATNCIIICICFHTVKAGLGIVISGSGSVGQGVGGYMPDNNSVALIAATTTPILYTCGTNILKRYNLDQFKPLALSLALLNSLTVVYAGSRGATLALVTGALFMTLLGKKKIKSLLVASTIAILAAITVVPASYFERVGTITDYRRPDGDASIHGRLHFWSISYSIFVNNPMGVGFQNFPYVYDKYDTSDGLHGNGRAVHNSHLQILTEGGFISFFGWLIANVFTLINLLKVIKNRRKLELKQAEPYQSLGTAMGASILAFWVGSTFGNYVYNDWIWTLLTLSTALTIAYHRENAIRPQLSLNTTPSLRMRRAGKAP